MKNIKNIIMTTLIISNLSTNILSNITYADENLALQETNLNENHQMTSSSNLTNSPKAEIDNLWDDGGFTPPPTQRDKNNRIGDNQIRCSSKWKNQFYFI